MRARQMYRADGNKLNVEGMLQPDRETVAYVI